MSNAIYTYTRKNAIEDGQQRELDPDLARQAGIKIPLFITSEAYANAIQLQPGDPGWQDERGRTWDVLSVFRFAVRVNTQASIFSFVVTVARREQERVKLLAQIGPKDIDDPSPAITLMLPHEV